MTRKKKGSSDQPLLRTKRPCPNSEAVKRETGRRLSMRTFVQLTTLRMRVDNQQKSLLFDLPPEIRLLVYEYALAEYTDGKNSYKPSALYRRPGHEGPHKTDTALLLTCRKAWLEANHLPLKVATHTFWFHNGPLDIVRMKQSAAMLDIERAGEEYSREVKRIPTETERYERFFQSLTPVNRTQVNHVHMFASESWLRAWVDRPSAVDNYFNEAWFATKTLAITIRHSEWIPERHFGQRFWLQPLLDASQLIDVREFRLELEGESFDEIRLASIAIKLASLSGRYFERCGEPFLHHWSKSTGSDAYPKSADLDAESPTSTSFSCLTIIWKSRMPLEGRRKHSEGYFTSNGEVEDWITRRQQFETKARKRGGRRSLPKSYRTHRLRQYADEHELKIMRKQDRAAGLMQQWKEEGSLLRLV